MSFLGVQIDKELEHAKRHLESVIPRGTEVEHKAILNVIAAIEYLREDIDERFFDLRYVDYDTED